MSPKIGFRTSLGGYNKNDVNEYVKERARETREQIAERDARIKALTEELEIERRSAAQSAQRLKADLSAQSGGLEDGISAVDAASRRIMEQLDGADRELENMILYRVKAEKFDKLAATLSDLLRLQGKTEQVSVPVMPDRSELKNEMESALAGLREDLKKLREAAGIL